MSDAASDACPAQAAAEYGCPAERGACGAQVSFYHRNLARQQQQVAQWLQKRRQENAQRRLAGEEALPEEDPVLFKPPPEPSPLDGFLIVSQARGARPRSSCLRAGRAWRLISGQPWR